MNRYFRVSIAIVGFKYKHDELTKFLKVKPTKVHQKGVKSSSAVVARLNAWIFEPESKKIDVDSRMALIFKNKKLFKLKSSKLKNCKIVIQCMLDLNGGNEPRISISEKNIALLAKLGATFDLDYYEAAK